MEFDKTQIISALEALGKHEQAQQASAQLPDKVNTDQHQSLLQQIGADVPELLQHLGSK